MKELYLAVLLKIFYVDNFYIFFDMELISVARDRDREAHGGTDPTSFSFLGCSTCRKNTVPPYDVAAIRGKV